MVDVAVLVVVCMTTDGLDAVVVPNCNLGTRDFMMMAGNDNGEDGALVFPNCHMRSR